jgi:hypothetical protein
MKNVSDISCRENQNAHFKFHFFFPKIVSFLRSCGKILLSRTDHRWQYGRCALPRARAHTHTHTQCAILDNGYTSPPQCYVIRTLPALLFLQSCSQVWWLAFFCVNSVQCHAVTKVQVTFKFPPEWCRHFIKCTVAYCRKPSRAKGATLPALIFVNKVKYRLRSSGTLQSFETSVTVYQPTQLNIPTLH